MRLQWQREYRYIFQQHCGGAVSAHTKHNNKTLAMGIADYYHFTASLQDEFKMSKSWFVASINLIFKARERIFFTVPS